MGGMYLLAAPGIEELLVGLVLVSSAPDATWLPDFFEMARRHPLPGVEEATARFEADPTNENLRELSMLCAAWNFGPMRSTPAASSSAGWPTTATRSAWSAEHFDSVYVARWWPRALPTLILSGSDDRIVDQSLWDDARFGGPNVVRREIDGGAHFPWIERPEAVRDAFAALVPLLAAQSSRS